MKRQIGSADNIANVMRAATRMECVTGTGYWLNLHDRLAAAAISKHIPRERMFGIFAALSPNNDEDGNFRDAYNLCHWLTRGGSKPSFNSYGANVTKASKIFTGEPPYKVLGGNKVRAYYANIECPVDPIPVCVDGHMKSVWLGQRVLLKSREANISDSQYAMIADDIRHVARKEGLLGNQVQAICWLAWKRIHRIRFNPQMKLWQYEDVA